MAVAFRKHCPQGPVGGLKRKHLSAAEREGDHTVLHDQEPEFLGHRGQRPGGKLHLRAAVPAGNGDCDDGVPRRRDGRGGGPLRCREERAAGGDGIRGGAVDRPGAHRAECHHRKQLRLHFSRGGMPEGIGKASGCDRVHGDCGPFRGNNGRDDSGMPGDPGSPRSSLLHGAGETPFGDAGGGECRQEGRCGRET